MAVTDPRERYDDLLVTWEEESFGADPFDDLRASEAVRSGWVAIGAVVDAEIGFCSPTTATTARGSSRGEP